MISIDDFTKEGSLIDENSKDRANAEVQGDGCLLSLDKGVSLCRILLNLDRKWYDKDCWLSRDSESSSRGVLRWSESESHSVHLIGRHGVWRGPREIGYFHGHTGRGSSS